jgi:hypothetical protein
VPISKRRIRVRIDYSKVPHAAYLIFVGAVIKNMTGNPHFPNSPIDLAVLSALLEKYRHLVSAADDGSKTVIAQRNSLRNQIDGLVRQIAFYVEAACDNDRAIFATSGFEALPDSYAPAEHLPPQRIVKLVHGANSGIIRVYLPPSYRKIKYVQIRFGIVPDPTTPPDSWAIETFAAARNPYTIGNLKPGAMYAFQVRAAGTLGSTDWSDSAILICI